jgi:predicted nucleic acid-binding protein
VNWYFDTSVLVSAALKAHPHNARALPVLEELLSRKYRGIISAHSLAEVYSVLTRTHSSLRCSRVKLGRLLKR